MNAEPRMQVGADNLQLTSSLKVLGPGSIRHFCILYAKVEWNLHRRWQGFVKSMSASVAPVCFLVAHVPITVPYV